MLKYVHKYSKLHKALNLTAVIGESALTLWGMSNVESPMAKAAVATVGVSGTVLTVKGINTVMSKNEPLVPAYATIEEADKARDDAMKAEQTEAEMIPAEVKESIVTALETLKKNLRKSKEDLIALDSIIAGADMSELEAVNDQYLVLDTKIADALAHEDKHTLTVLRSLDAEFDEFFSRLNNLYMKAEKNCLTKATSIMNG